MTLLFERDLSAVIMSVYLDSILRCLPWLVLWNNEFISRFVFQMQFCVPKMLQKADGNKVLSKIKAHVLVKVVQRRT